MSTQEVAALRQRKSRREESKSGHTSPEESLPDYRIQVLVHISHGQ